MKKLENYRLRVSKPQGDRPYATYIVRKNGRVFYTSATETPLALSNLVHDDAADMRFKLEDAATGSEAATALRKVLEAQWANNKPLCPKVEVL